MVVMIFEVKKKGEVIFAFYFVICSSTSSV